MKPAWKRRAGIVLALAIAAAAAAWAWRTWPGPPAAGGPRNILVLVLDGVGTRLGAYGAPVRTPSLDRLARQGRRFDLAFRNHPAPAVARSALWLGRRPESWRAWDHAGPMAAPPQGAVPLPRPLLDRGYFTARLGSLAGEGEQGGPWQEVEEAAGPPRVADDGIDARTRRIAGWLDQAGPRPFLIAAAYASPPPGWLPPASFLSGYPVADVRPDATPRRDWSRLPRIAVPGGRIPASDVVAGDPPLRRQQAAADAYVSFLDAQVGFLLDTLERQGLGANTTVVVIGDAPNDPARAWRSDVLFDESLRVSLIVRSPEVRRPGRPAASPVELLDLYATLLELAGAAPPPGTQGRSLGNLLRDAGAEPDRAALAALPRSVDRLGRSLRTERFRYTRWPDGSEELYDHQADALEQVNRARADPPPELEGLRRDLDDGPPPATPEAAARSWPAKRSGALNVLLIVVDDLNTRLGSYGYDVQTPNVDRLARQGRRFERAYAQYASCNPSRTSFLTGLRPETTGVWSNLQSPRGALAGAVPLQEHFRRHGYFTARVGKVYHGPFEAEFRWDLAEHSDYSGVEAADEDPPLRSEGRGRRGGIAGFWHATDLADADEPDGRTVRRVAELLATRRSRPFLIAAGLNKPHLRWSVPRRYFDLYPPERIRLPPERADDWSDIPEIAIARGAPRFAGALLRGPLEPADLRAQAVAAYQACVTFMDAQVGVLLAALDAQRLWDRTAVVLLGDHGFHLGEHSGLWRKNTLFEESLRTPLVIAAPGVQQTGVASPGVVELLDLYPTLLDLAGLPAVPGIQGSSLSPALRDPHARIKRAAFSVTERTPPAAGLSVRTRRYRYTLWPDGSEELYDHASDPTESRNLGLSEGHVAIRADLRARLESVP